MRPNQSSEGTCPNCRASLSSSDATVSFESAGGRNVTLVECPSCREVVSPEDRSPDGRDSVRVSRGRRVHSRCATCGASVSLVVPEHSVVTDRRPDGVVHVTCERCDGVTAVGFRRRGRRRDD